jgi:hypothetical protein
MHRINGLGDTQALVGSTVAGACVAGAIAAPGTFGVSAALTCLPSIIKAFLGWLTCGPTSACALKVTATQFAEGIVKLCYGLEPGCALPPGGIAIVPGANPPKFCSYSVAGLIERCDLYNASIVLNRAQSLMQQKLTVTSDPVTPYVQRWYDQYGPATFNDLKSHLAAAQAVCGAAASQPGNQSQYPGGIIPTPTGSSYTPYIILGGIGLVGLFFMMR